MAAIGTDRLRLAPCVTDPYTRHPAVTAMQIATLDEIAHGRAVLVMGAGRGGFREMGLVQPSPATALKEAVELIRRLLRGETVTYQGKIVRFFDGRLNLPPRPHIPVLIASYSRFALRAAGEVASGAVIAQATLPENLGRALRWVGEGLVRAGRARSAIRVLARLDVCVASEGSAALQPLKLWVARILLRRRPHLEFLDEVGLATPPALADLVYTVEYLGSSRAPETLDRVASHIPDDFVFPFCLGGTPAMVREQMAQVLRLGVDGFILKPMAPSGTTIEEAIRDIAETLRPFSTEAPLFGQVQTG
jgi:5,10-methylenetetrahydromethanopterin reductase